MSTSNAVTEPPWVRRLLIFIAVLVLALFVMLPLFAVFVEAFRKGWEVFVASLTDSIALSAIKLTLIAALVSIPLNTLFGLACAWLVTKHRFRGRAFLLSLVDLPFAVSPVIAGLIWIMVFGNAGWFPKAKLTHFLEPAVTWLQVHLPSLITHAPFSAIFSWMQDPKIIFATPGIILATVFVTFPFVARELIPLMESQGTDEEEAAVTLGASGWRVFTRVTLPNIKWGLLYGVLLANARAMGEFGAVSVVSGHIRGSTNTLPLHIEVLYNDYQFSAAFACATLLALLGLVTLALKTLVEKLVKRSSAGLNH
jgi:sulfate/thiosulfate transport system permease protein